MTEVFIKCRIYLTTTLYCHSLGQIQNYSTKISKITYIFLNVKASYLTNLPLYSDKRQNEMYKAVTVTTLIKILKSYFKDIT